MKNGHPPPLVGIKDSTLGGFLRNNACVLFTAAFIMAMFLPRLVTKGMFGDGLLYASMARNLAVSKGSLWQPVFSSGYWLDYVKPVYYENLPLMIWAESLFFSILGEVWWVEKLFSLLVLVMNIALIVRIWRRVAHPLSSAPDFAWMPVLLWYVIPPVMWGNPNNLMDCFQVIFCLLAVDFFLKMCLGSNRLPFRAIALGSTCVFLAVLAKGPVGLYPLAVPVVYAVFFAKDRLLNGFLRATVSFTIVAGFFGAMMFFIPSAKTYLLEYWQQRLLAVLQGSREDANLSGWSRLAIFQLLVVEMAPLIGIVLIVGLLRFLGKIRPQNDQNLLKWSGCFFLMGLAATLPIMASARQNGMYLIPGMPMFAMAGAFFLYSSVGQHIEDFCANKKYMYRLSFFSGLLIGGALFFSGYVFGTYGREKGLQKDMETLLPIIPRGARVGAAPAVMKDFSAHTYLQRFHHIELTAQTESSIFLLADPVLDSVYLQKNETDGHRKILFKGEKLMLYAAFAQSN